MKTFTVVLVLLIAAVSSVYSQCQSVDETKLVTCYKNRNCGAFAKQCLRARCGNHTAPCLRGKFTSAKQDIRRKILSAEARDLPTITNGFPYIHITFTNIKVTQYNRKKRVTASTGGDTNTVTLNGIKLKVTMDWVRKEQSIRRVSNGRFRFMQTRYIPFSGKATITATDSNIACTYQAATCANVQCKTQLNNFNFGHTGNLGSVLQTHLPPHFKKSMATEASKLMRGAVMEQLPTMECN